VLIGLHAHGRTAAREASPISPALVAAVCGSYTVSAVAVGVIDEPEVAAVVPAGALALLLAGVLGPLRAHAAPGARAA
jgi:hypothetical protein